MTDELAQALAIANRVLDRPNADPDDDLCVLARQLSRTVENAARHLLWLRTGPHPPEQAAMIQAERDAWFKRLTAAIDPEGAAEGRYG